MCLGGLCGTKPGVRIGSTGRGVAIGAEVETMDGAGVIGVKSEDGPCAGEVGREKAVKGIVGGSKGEAGCTGRHGRVVSGRDGFLSLTGWLEMIEPK